MEEPYDIRLDFAIYLFGIGRQCINWNEY
jgi:hypothetical protein